MKRAFYINSIDAFLCQNEDSILGELARNNPFTLEDKQKNSWIEEIRLLKRTLSDFGRGYLAFEYTIPRIGNRIDVVILLDGIVFLLEFKVGSKDFAKHDTDQVIDYALDLKNFHKMSHDLLIVPILVSTNALEYPIYLTEIKSGILDVIKCNSLSIKSALEKVLSNYESKAFPAYNWFNSPYAPTPTIIEAAQALYRGHNVADISRNDASAVNLNLTTEAINKIIEKSKKEKRKSICFITGVPGAGKTLAGLNIANERHKFDESEHAVFLSGNKPLVDVLQEALARDDHERTGIRKNEAMSKAKSFIQIIHHFRDDAISTSDAPIEKVAIFDEAQRAWEEDMLKRFMAQKKGIPNFEMSEPEFLISIMDRHVDWAVIICLIGGGQEINTGEAGLIEWFDSLREGFGNWDIYISDKITDVEYTRGHDVKKLFEGLSYSVVEELHLAVSLRSFRSEKVSGFVKALLDVEVETARYLYENLIHDYPILMTRSLEKAKTWVRSIANGTERYGLTASSGAHRLRSHGIWIQKRVEATKWFLNGKDDVRSSYYLEDTATEFDIQGLELDWTIVCWDADFRFVNDHFEYHSFRGTKWQNINKPEIALYLKNTYRVLLTRARQGMIIFIPEGSDDDHTRPKEYYDGTYDYLKEIGIQEI